MISSDIFNYSHKFLRGASRELIQRHCTHWLVLILKQGLDFANRVRSQQYVSAYRTNVSRNVVNDHYLATVSYGVYDFSRFVFSRTSINAAFHSDCFF